MSELGSKEGQEQNENAPFFDSAKISEKKDVEHFSNVEGAEMRAKAAERAKKAAEKEAAEVHAADVRAASERMKKAEKENTGKKSGILGFLFGGWHKIITILLLIALAALVVFLVVNHLVNNGSQKLSYKDSAKQYYEQQREAVNVGEDLEAYTAARDAYQQRYENAQNEHERFYEGYYYSLFVYFEGINFSDALSVFDSVEIPEGYTNEEACDIKDAARFFYEDNDFSNNEELEAVIKDCKNDEEE